MGKIIYPIFPIIISNKHTKVIPEVGMIELREKNFSKAIEHYEKFLHLWKDADPGMAEVEDARERLAGLKGT